ncbi:hypothetical protein [Cupriavidus sp. TMH.W2]|uniref:hypothetical protein n=1 Tax=Cupriavidus sp. TMH.W2 TaxID=3434465 RepID=UPI003D778EE9
MTAAGFAIHPTRTPPLPTCWTLSGGPRLLQVIDRTIQIEEAIRAEIANGMVEQSWLAKALGPYGL